MMPTRIVCALALALGLAAPAHAQFDLLRKLVPQVPAIGNMAAGRKHAETVNAIVQRAGMGDIKEAARMAEALVADERKEGDTSPLAPGGAMLRQSISLAADLQERDGNHARAIELYQLLLASRSAPAGLGLPGDLATLAHIGELQSKAGDFAAARRSYQEALARPESASPLAQGLRPRLYAGLGLAALQLGDDALAETNLLLAIRENPAISGQPQGNAPGRGSSFFDVITVMSAATGRIQDTLKSMAPDHALLDSNGEVLSPVTGKPIAPPNVLEVEGPLTDLALLYFRRHDTAALKVLYLVTFSEYAARTEGVDTGGLGPPVQLEKQYTRFGAYLAGLKEYGLAQQAFDTALRLNARRLTAAAVQVVPEQLGAFFAARRQILDLAISLRLAERAAAPAWRATLSELLQSKGLQSDFLARRARLIGRSADPETRRLAAEMEAIDAAEGMDQYLRRANIAYALQSKVGPQLSPLAFQAGEGFVAELQRRLEKETLLSLFVFTVFDFDSQRFGPKHYLGARVSADSMKVADLGSAETLDALGASLRADLAQRPAGGRAPAVLHSARSAYDALLKPLAGARAARGAWVADLDGAMSLLPMEALADASGRYLIEDTEWRYVSSARALLRGTPASAAGRGAPGRSVVLAAPAYDMEPAPAAGAAPALSRGAALQGLRFEPLPQTLEEGKAVAAALQRGGNQVELRAGPEAGMQVLTQLHAPRYLHIATHGFFVEEAGSRRQQVTGFDRKRYTAESYAQGRSSGLALAGANRSLAAGAGDGVMFAAQLRQLDLAGTELAVLSACDTSIGAITLGEGVDSLRQALDIAGAATTVTSLWPVADTETRLLMTDFYGALAAGDAKAGALRQAKLHVKQLHPHPYYWAAFVLSGMR